MAPETTTPEKVETTETLKTEIPIGQSFIPVEEIAEGLKTLPRGVFLQVMRDLIRSGAGDALKLMVDGLEIQMTPSVFGDEERQETLEQTARDYPFSRYLNEMGISPKEATRENLCDWWDSFMVMAGESGFQAGGIDSVSRDTNLWKATGPLSEKMLGDPAQYRFLPALLLNHPQEVDRVLGEIKEAEPFMEILTGERMDDMRKSPEFLGAFSTVEKPGGEPGEISREVRDAIFTVTLVLQRKG